MLLDPSEVLAQMLDATLEFVRRQGMLPRTQ
jgi:hypothetical protein